MSKKNATLDWDLLPYDFDNPLRKLSAELKLRRYRAILDYDTKFNTLTDVQRAKLKVLISLWTEVLSEMSTVPMRGYQ